MFEAPRFFYLMTKGHTMSADNRQLRLKEWLQKDELSVYESSMLLCGRDPYEFSGISEALENLEGDAKESLTVVYRHLSDSFDYVKRNWQLVLDPRDEYELEVEKSKIRSHDLQIFAENHGYPLPGLKEIRHHDDFTYLEIINALTRLLYLYQQSEQFVPGYSNYKFIKPDGSISARGLMVLMNTVGSVKSNADRIISEAVEISPFEIST